MLFIFLILNLDFEIKEGQSAPVIDGSRAGLGVFPPLNDIMVSVTPREL
jgi:hypothetical protein